MKGEINETFHVLLGDEAGDTVSTNCLDNETLQESTKPMEYSLAAFWSEKEKREREKEGRPRRGKKGGMWGQIWIPIPFG